MAAPQQFDVWFVAADTVYRGVPYGVVAGWAEQGRVSADDKLRPAGSAEAWVRVGDHPRVADFLYRRPAGPVGPAEQLQPVEMDLGPHREVDDEDVDMIPLIDISLVLLIFFMMTTAVAALSPVDVPDLAYVSQPSNEKDAISIHIDKRSSGDVFFALRIGDKQPAPEDNNLATPEELLRRLDARLAEAQRPPEVRIACNRDLERGWLRDIARELDKRKQKDQIASYFAEVNEQKK
jgi:biopolymer transport protein ExbD